MAQHDTLSRQSEGQPDGAPTAWREEGPTNAAAQRPTHRHCGLTVETLTSRSDLETLAGSWNELANASSARSIFLTWEWITAWLDVQDVAPPLHVVVVRDDRSRLAAVAPFYRTRMRLAGLVSYRCLRVLGDTGSGAEYPDLIVRTGFEEAAIPLIARALLADPHRWDCLWCPNMAGWSGALDRITALCPSAAFHLHERPCDFAIADLPETHDEYLRSLSANARSSIKRRTKAFFKADIGGEFVRCEHADHLPQFLSALFELHRRRWSTEDDPGSFVREPRMARFYERFAPAAFANGWLRMYALKIAGTIEAVQYGYVHDGVFYQLQEGFNPDAMAGIGNVLRNLVFQACIEERLRQYDFLGMYTDHKRRWGATKRPGHDIFAGRRSLKNRLLFTKNVWPTGRFLAEDSVGDTEIDRHGTGT